MNCNVTLGNLLEALHNDASMTDAASRIRLASFAPLVALLERGNQPGDARSPSTVIVTSGMGPVLLEPFAQVGSPAAADERRQYIESIRGEAQQALGDLSLAIDEMLADKTLLPTSAEARVCDYAYIAMRRVARFDANTESNNRSAQRVFALDEVARDEEITTQRTSPIWGRLVAEGYRDNVAVLTLPSPESTCVPSVAADTYVAKFDATPERDLGALSRPLKDDALLIARALNAIARGPHPLLSVNAQRLMLELGTLPIEPVLESGAPNSTQLRVWYVQHLASMVESLRQAAEVALFPLLDDKRPLPPISLGKIRVEEKEISRRVCDQAYLAMHSLCPLVSPESFEEEQLDYLHASTFLQDALIDRAKKTHHFRGPTLAELRDDLKAHPPPEFPEE